MQSRKTGGGVAAIIPAAGSGRRLGFRKPKPFVRVLGRPLIVHTIKNLERSYRFTEIIVAASPRSVRRMRRCLAQFHCKNIKITSGGQTRAQSVFNGLKEVSDECGWVIVHDAARPFVDSTLVKRLLAAAKTSGAAICAAPIHATVKRVNPKGRWIEGTEDRSRFFLAQTPQVFQRKLLQKRYESLGRAALTGTDCAALFDGSGIRVRVVPGDAKNIKITTPEDIELMKFYLR